MNRDEETYKKKKKIKNQKSKKYDIISLSCHEQVCLSELRIKKI